MRHAVAIQSFFNDFTSNVAESGKTVMDFLFAFAVAGIAAMGLLLETCNQGTTLH